MPVTLKHDCKGGNGSKCLPVAYFNPFFFVSFRGNWIPASAQCSFIFIRWAGRRELICQRSTFHEAMLPFFVARKNQSGWKKKLWDMPRQADGQEEEEVLLIKVLFIDGPGLIKKVRKNTIRENWRCFLGQFRFAQKSVVARKETLSDYCSSHLTY